MWRGSVAVSSTTIHTVDAAAAAGGAAGDVERPTLVIPRTATGSSCCDSDGAHAEPGVDELLVVGEVLAETTHDDDRCLGPDRDRQEHRDVLDGEQLDEQPPTPITISLGATVTYRQQFAERAIHRARLPRRARRSRQVVPRLVPFRHRGHSHRAAAVEAGPARSN